MNDFVCFRKLDNRKNGGSILYVHRDYAISMLRIIKEGDNDSEMIHVRLESSLKLNVIGLNLETNASKEEVDNRHELISKKVDKCIKRDKGCILMVDT